MPVPDEIRKLTEEVVVSFDSGVGAVRFLIEKGLEILDGYRREEEALRGSLRETLSSVASLRRKDFDAVTAPILDFQSRREAEIKGLIKSLLARQKDLTGRLKRCLEAGILQEVERIKKELPAMIEQARQEVISFQREQERIRTTFASLQAQKGEITAREFKKAIQDLEREHLGPAFEAEVSMLAVGEK